LVAGVQLGDIQGNSLSQSAATRLNARSIARAVTVDTRRVAPGS
jgi:hypothetical protein